MYGITQFEFILGDREGEWADNKTEHDQNQAMCDESHASFYLFVLQQTAVVRKLRYCWGQETG